VSAMSPQGLERLARRRYVAHTGQQWQHALLETRRAWLREIEPVLRAEHGIAADAVWRDGAWQAAEQADLFPDLPTGHKGVSREGEPARRLTRAGQGSDTPGQGDRR
jgi:hypothetical protein